MLCIVFGLGTTAEVQAQTLQQTKIWFHIKNAQRVGHDYSFDIYISAQDTGHYLLTAQVYFLYNTQAFGDSVVTNGHFTVGDAKLIGMAADSFPIGFPLFPKYIFSTPPGAQDNSANQVALLINTFAPIIYGPHLNPQVKPNDLVNTSKIPTVPTPMARIHMRLLDTTKSPAINLNLPFMINNVFAGTLQGDLCQGDVSVLPANFISLRGKAMGDGSVYLSWRVSSSHQNDHYVIEKRMPSGRFEEIGRLDGEAQEGEQHVDFTDRSPMRRYNDYRIKACNFDGGIAFSDVVQVRFDKKVSQLRVYPNPTSGRLILSPSFVLERDHHYALYDMRGQLVEHGVIHPGDMVRGYALDLSGLRAGIYALSLRSSQGTTTQKVLVVKQ